MKNEKPVPSNNSRSQERSKRQTAVKTAMNDETIYVEFVTNLDRISDRDIENALVEQNAYSALRT